MNIVSEAYSLSVIVPFYNEERYLAESVQRLLNIQICNQILLVDDNSSDNSLKIAKTIQASNNNVELIKLTNNQGKGNAIREALKSVKSTHTIVHDADLEYFPEDIIPMFDLAKKYPNSMVIGSRTLDGKERDNKYKLTFYANKYLTYLFSILNLSHLSDIASCYWLIETKILKKLNITEKGFSIEVEVLSKFLRTKNKILEVPISYSGRTYQDGKKIKFVDGIKIFFKILKYSKLANPFKFIKI